jgi:hypothetical protein
LAEPPQAAILQGESRPIYKAEDISRAYHVLQRFGHGEQYSGAELAKAITIVIKSGVPFALRRGIFSALEQLLSHESREVRALAEKTLSKFRVFEEQDPLDIKFRNIRRIVEAEKLSRRLKNTPEGLYNTLRQKASVPVTRKRIVQKLIKTDSENIFKRILADLENPFDELKVVDEMVDLYMSKGLTRCDVLTKLAEHHYWKVLERILGVFGDPVIPETEKQKISAKLGPKELEDLQDRLAHPGGTRIQ